MTKIYSSIHECAHNLVLKGKTGNMIASIIADLANTIPSAISFRGYHLKHHAFQGNYYLDADLASRWEAKLIGKPSPIFYHSGLKAIGFSENSEFVMIGDDIETDIDGAQNIGGKGILIYTGKTKYPLPEDCKIKPFAEIQTLTEIIPFFG